LKSHAHTSHFWICKHLHERGGNYHRITNADGRLFALICPRCYNWEPGQLELGSICSQCAAENLYPRLKADLTHQAELFASN